MNKFTLGLSVLAVLLAIGSFFLPRSSSQLIGATQTYPVHVSNATSWDTGFFWGNHEIAGTTWMDGAVNASGTVTFAGATNLNSTLAVTNTSTLTGGLVANGIINSFGSTASSTIQVGAASKAGCIILGDSANGASVVYITATGTTITATTTKPAACQTAL